MVRQNKKSILVVGAGFVGLATAVFLAEKGNEVHVIEKNRFTVEILNTGCLHFREEELRKRYISLFKNSKLTVGLPHPNAYRDRDFIILAIDSADMKQYKMRTASFERIIENTGQGIIGKKSCNCFKIHEYSWICPKITKTDRPTSKR